MKRLLKHIPTWVFSAIIACAVTSGGAFAYNAATYTGDIIVVEPVSLSTTTPFSIEINPGSIEQLEVEIINTSDSEITIYPSYNITPNPGQEVYLDMDAEYTIPASTSLIITIDVLATNSAEPGTYEGEIIIDR